MSKTEITWPTVRTTLSDKGIMDAIRTHDGRLKNITSKDLLLIAASLAVENNGQKLRRLCAQRDLISQDEVSRRKRWRR